VDDIPQMIGSTRQKIDKFYELDGRNRNPEPANEEYLKEELVESSQIAERLADGFWHSRQQEKMD
jgi:hypothetical protein